MITKEQMEEYNRSRMKMPKASVRELLAERSRECYYCHIQTKAYPEIQNRKLKKGEFFPDDMTTLEHLYDRFDERRYLVYPNYEDKVIACWNCNRKRAVERMKTLPKSFRKERDEKAKKREKGTPRAFVLDFIEKL